MLADQHTLKLLIRQSVRALLGPIGQHDHRLQSQFDSGKPEGVNQTCKNLMNAVPGNPRASQAKTRNFELSGKHPVEAIPGKPADITVLIMGLDISQFSHRIFQLLKQLRIPGCVHHSSGCG
ncbi:hypothetical protein D3C75_787830 [compost metagenome]